MDTSLMTMKMEIRHRDYNLEKKDNLDEVPAESAVFGVFAIVNGQPVNCRYVGAAQDLRAAIRSLFENSPEPGLRKFMQGPWIQMLQFELLPGASPERLAEAARSWEKEFQPKIDEAGEYPGYYE